MKKSSLRTYVKGARQGGCNLFCWQFMVKTVNCQQFEFNEQSLSSASPPPLPQKVESGRIPSPPVPTSFALRASTMTLIELGSITKNKHPVSFILKTWQTWNPAFCSCSNTCIFPWKTNSSHLGTKLYRFDQSHQRDIIPEVGHGKTSMHDYFVDAIYNTVSLNLVRPYWMN